MKKNPIDELFARKLADAEVTPRAEAWEKLQRRQKTTPFGGIWQQWTPWLAAAGVSLLLVGVWLTRQPQPNEQSTRIAQQKTKRTPTSPKATPTTSLPVLEAQREVAAKQATLKQQKRETTQAVSQPTPTSVEVAQTSVPKPSETTQPKEVVEIKTELTHVAATQNIAMTEAKPAERKVVWQMPELKTTETLVATVAESPTVTTENHLEYLEKNRKTSRASKVWQQLKNAKNGEKVDWDEVGFNPNKLIAKATGKKDNNEQ